MYYILQSILVLGVQETAGIILQDQPLQISPLYAKNGKAQCSKKDSKWLLFLMSAKLNLSLKISLQKKSNHIYLQKVQIIKYVQNISTEGLSQVQILYLTHERPLFKVPSIYIFWKTQQSCLKVYSRLFQQVSAGQTTFPAYPMEQMPMHAHTQSLGRPVNQTFDPS